MVKQVRQLNDSDHLNAEMMSAIEAEQVLENPQFKKAAQAIKDHLLLAWTSSKPLDIELRENIHKQFKAVTTIEGILRATIEGGTLAAEEVERQSVFSKAYEKVQSLWQS